MKIDKQIVLESKHLRLRIPALEDIDAVFSATRFAGFNDGMLWDPPNTKDELIEPYYRGIKAWEEGKGYSFTIESQILNEFLGRISIRETDSVDRWNVGFWTHPKHQEQGIMTEALGVLLQFGFERLHANTIEACCATWNTASEKVMNKNGMRFSKHIAKGFKKNGKWIEENLYVIDKEDWGILKKDKTL